MIIAIDFDGTIVESCFPSIGPMVPGAIEAMNMLQLKGHKLILWTLRSGHYLNNAVECCKENGITFYGINYNQNQFDNTSNKIYCDLFIDDKSLGCPVIKQPGKRPYVDWVKVCDILRNCHNIDGEANITMNEYAGPKS